MMKIRLAILTVGVVVALQFPTSAQDFYLDMAVHYGNNCSADLPSFSKTWTTPTAIWPT